MIWEAVIAHADWSLELLSALAAIRAGSRKAARERFFSDHNRLFAHYTSADTVKKVLDSRGFYMRNSRLMNDHSEVSHGFQMVLTAVSETGGGSQYKAAWSSVEPRLGERLPQLIAESAGKVMDDCFIISVSEHLGGGRRRSPVHVAGPWHRRPLGRNCRKAWHRCADGGGRSFLDGVPLRRCSRRRQGAWGQAAALCRHAGTFRDLSPELIEQLALADAVNFAVSIKHPGFAEEREWRFVYMTDFPSPEMNARREAVVWGGIPQIVSRLPIILPCDAGWTPDRLSLERIILGPCAESRTVRRGLVQLLGDYSFDNAEDIVRASSIPYRQKM